MTADTDIRIRAAREADAAGLAHVHVSSWCSTYRGIVPDAHLDGMSVDRSSARWKENLARDTNAGWFTIVAENAGAIIGFASAGPVRTEDPGYTGELGGIYLLASHQRRGTGRRLVAEVARLLRERGLCSMLVWVLRDNPSRAFYEALGGEYVREQIITIGGTDLVEVAYGWKDTAALAKLHVVETGGYGNRPG
jgi:L-amino acid N-acyltransferase YncA